MPAEADRSATAPAEALAALNAAADRTRLICVPAYDAAACSAALVALANSRGGHLLLGATLDAAGGALRPGEAPATGVDQRLLDLAAAIDPPLTDLLRVSGIRLEGAPLVLVAARRSVRTPHIDPISGRIFMVDAEGTIVPVRRRQDLDRLYRRGAVPEEHARRTIDGMVERLQLASFGHYGLAIVAALLQPSGAPYEAAHTHPDTLAPGSDPFVDAWGLAGVAATVRPSWIELRLEREVTGVLRLTRAGCAVAGETRQLPADKALGRLDELAARLQVIIDSACRLLRPAGDAEILPLLLCEGLRGTHLRAGLPAGSVSADAGQDTLQVMGPRGAATDGDYRRGLAAAFAERLAAAYGLAPAGEAATAG